MKSTMTDKELIDASKPHTHRADQNLRPEHFHLGMLASMRAIADAAVTRAVADRKAPMHPAGLRDEFAGRCLTGVLSTETGANEFTFAERARWCYQQADAMLEARNARS